MSVLKQRFVVTGTQLSTAIAKMTQDSAAQAALEGQPPTGELKRRLEGSGIGRMPPERPSDKVIGDTIAKAIIFYLKEK